MISHISCLLEAFRPCFTRHPLCAELHEGVEALRSFQQKAPPLVDGQPKVSITSLMAAMAAELVPELGRKCILVLDAYFAVGPVFAILKTVRDATGQRLVHVVTRAKSNVVAYADAPPRTGLPGRPRIYGQKLNLMELFDTRRTSFEQAESSCTGRLKTWRFSVWTCAGSRSARRYVLYWSPMVPSGSF